MDKAVRRLFATQNNIAENQIYYDREARLNNAQAREKSARLETDHFDRELRDGVDLQHTRSGFVWSVDTYIAKFFPWRAGRSIFGGDFIDAKIPERFNWQPSERPRCRKVR